MGMGRTPRKTVIILSHIWVIEYVIEFFGKYSNSSEGDLNLTLQHIRLQIVDV